MKLIVYDSNDPLAKQNKIFDPIYNSNQPGRSVLTKLCSSARARGIEIITSDIFLERTRKTGKFLLYSEMITPQTYKIIEENQVSPVVCYSWESPNAVWSFYHNLEQNLHGFQHAFLFRGVKEKVKDPTQFHPVFWPMPTRTVLEGPAWTQRNYLVMVVSNKNRFSIAPHKPFPEARRRLKQLLWGYLQLRDPMFRFPDLYHVRLKSILFFLNIEGFRLFGTGWDKHNGLNQQTWQAVQKINPRPVEDKLREISNFKFTICFENCIFPGYVTEKILDAFLAGCIPIYLGAPDIADFVPPDTFIDFRRFHDFSELDRFLQQMTEAEARHYLDAARDFLNSSSFDKYSAKQNADELINIFDQNF